MADLNLNTVELTSTLRTAPLNGAPSSSDYNESQRETLVDLATLSSFINNQILPLINALPDTALLPALSPVGIEGRTIWSDTSDQGNLFFDSLSSVPLTLADTIRVINGIITTMKQQLIDQGVEVASLQARLASTNQNDIALALQNLSSSLNQVTVNQVTQTTQITELQGSQTIGTRTSSSIPVTVPAGSAIDIAVVFAVPYNGNFYTATVSLEAVDTISELVNVGSFQKDGIGLGVTVSVVNYDTVDHAVLVHVISQYDTGA